MNTDVMFSSASAEWETPQDLFDELNNEFHFGIDLAATKENTKCPVYFDMSMDALSFPWPIGETCWLNPPYGRGVGRWVEKAYKDSINGTTIVCLLPARTDTRWFHDYVWDETLNRSRDNVELRLLKGRLKFGGATNSAPFPSMIVVFRPPSKLIVP